MTFNLKKYNASVGFTLIELMLTIAIIAILAAIANASYLSYRERVDFELTVADIKTIEQSIERYFVIHNMLFKSNHCIFIKNILCFCYYFF